MKKILALISGVVMLFSHIAFADSETFGEVDAFTFGGSKIIIDDRVFYLQLDAVIRDEGGNGVNRTALNQGKKIMFTATWQNNRMLISTVDILPDSARREEFEQEDDE